MAEAARLVGRDRTRVYALIRSGDMVAVPVDLDEGSGPLRIDRASLERWLVTGGGQGGPFSLRNAWAIIGLASGEPSLSERCVGLLERPEDASRARSRLGKLGLLELAPRLRRRASSLVVRLPACLVTALEHEAPLAALAALQQQADRLDADAGGEHLDAVLLRTVSVAMVDHIAREPGRHDARRDAAAGGADPGSCRCADRRAVNWPDNCCLAPPCGVEESEPRSEHPRVRFREENGRRRPSPMRW